jgi:hypothetical protein
MKTRLLSITLFVITAFYFIGCKKNSDSAGECKIVSTTSSISGGVLNVFYDNNGRVIKTVAGLSVDTYDYNGNIVTYVAKYNGNFSSKVVYTLNNEGLIIKSKTTVDELGDRWDERIYEYNGTEVIKETLTSYLGSGLITTFTWQDGNMVAIYVGGVLSSTMEYYLDKSSATGDYFHSWRPKNQLVLCRTKNAPKSSMLLSPAGTKSFSYEYDQDGKIVATTTNNGPSLPQTKAIYQYDCN